MAPVTGAALAAIAGTAATPGQLRLSRQAVEFWPESPKQCRDFAPDPVRPRWENDSHPAVTPPLVSSWPPQPWNPDSQQHMPGKGADLGPTRSDVFAAGGRLRFSFMWRSRGTFCRDPGASPRWRVYLGGLRSLTPDPRLGRYHDAMQAQRGAVQVICCDKLRGSVDVMCVDAPPPANRTVGPVVAHFMWQYHNTYPHWSEELWMGFSLLDQRSRELALGPGAPAATHWMLHPPPAWGKAASWNAALWGILEPGMQRAGVKRVATLTELGRFVPPGTCLREARRSFPVSSGWAGLTRDYFATERDAPRARRLLLAALPAAARSACPPDPGEMLLGSARDAAPALAAPLRIAVYARRGETRELRHAEQLERMLREAVPAAQVVSLNGFGRMSFTEQHLALCGVGLLIAAHGAMLANAIMLPQCAAVLEVQPFRYYIPTGYSTYVAGSGHYWAAWYDSEGKAADNSVRRCPQQHEHLSARCRFATRAAPIDVSAHFSKLVEAALALISLRRTCIARLAGGAGLRATV